MACEGENGAEDFFIYNLPEVPSCSLRYCTDTSAFGNQANNAYGDNCPDVD